MSGVKNAPELTPNELYNHSFRIITTQNINAALERPLIKVIIERNYLEEFCLKL
jgi:hypothetical protein